MNYLSNEPPINATNKIPLTQLTGKLPNKFPTNPKNKMLNDPPVNITDKISNDPPIKPTAKIVLPAI